MIYDILFFLFPLLLIIVPLICYKNNHTFMQRFYIRMTYSYHCRKFYSLIILMLLIMYHYIAHQIMPMEFGIMGSSVFILLFFRFKYANRILRLLNDKQLFCFIAMIAALVFLFVPHLFTLSATIGILLLAALFYPSSHVLYKAKMPNDDRHFAKYPHTIVNFYY